MTTYHRLLTNLFKTELLTKLYTTDVLLGDDQPFSVFALRISSDHDFLSLTTNLIKIIFTIHPQPNFFIWDIDATAGE